VAIRTTCGYDTKVLS